MAQLTIEQAIQVALGHHQAGRGAEAEAIYRQVLAEFPDHAGALHLLGVLAGQAGYTESAIDLIGRAIAIDGAVPEYHTNLGEFWSRAAQWDRAIASLRRAIELKPDLAVAHGNLGNALKAAGRVNEAIAAYGRAIELGGGYATVQSNLGVVLHEAGRWDEAVDAYRRAIALEPGMAEASYNLGTTLTVLGQLDDAIAAFGRAIELSPEHALAHNNRGGVLHGAGRLDEAITAYRRAIALKPDFAVAHGNLGRVLNDAGRTDEAIDVLQRAIELKPDSAEAHTTLGAAWLTVGQCDEALTCFRRALNQKPDYAPAASNLLFTAHFHPDHDARSLLAEHRRWAAEFATPLAAQIQPHRSDRNPDRKLRVGFVSPDFSMHPVGRLLRPLFTHRDRRDADFFAYSDVRAPDAATHELKAMADAWLSIVGMSDSRVADRIRNDRIDILVDLALHTAGNRMLVFARKPAPVQVSMLGMPTTTGLATIDYRLTDRYLDPPGLADAAYTERSIRLPHSIWCYEPPAEAPAVGPLPAGNVGLVTFGCLNQLAKVSRTAMQAWIAILQSLPGARLLLQSPPSTHQEPLRRRFLEAGIAPDRIDFLGRVPRCEYFRRYLDLDVSLDPFPYNGHTTTFDALWMGVPVVTLAGRTGVGRGGVSILSNLGLPELIAQTPEQYVTIAVGLVSDLNRLAQLRSGLRQRMRSSPLMDGKQYAADVETAFRRMWQIWCSR